MQKKCDEFFTAFIILQFKRFYNEIFLQQGDSHVTLTPRLLLIEMLGMLNI